MTAPTKIFVESNRLVLTGGERSSATWNTVSTFLREYVARLDVVNRGNLDEITTAKVRGQIALLNELLDAEKDDPVVETSNL